MSTSRVDRTVLIDDSDIDLFIQRRFLEVCNFSNELFQYKSAQAALNWLKKLNNDTFPDIIFLDLNMPEIDGFSFLKNFNDLPPRITGKTKIVVLTSSNSLKDRNEVLENKNVIQFITKPLRRADIEEVCKLIQDNK